MYNWNDANIDTIAGGDAKAKVNFAICEAVANCIDHNRDYKKKRTVFLKITLQPKENRRDIEVLAEASTKLVPDKPVTDHWSVDGNGVAKTNSASQMDLEDDILNGAISTMEGKGK